MFFKGLLLSLLFLALLDTSLAGFMPKAFEGEYVQVKKSKNKWSKKTKEAPVSIAYQFPRNIRLHSKDPDQDILYICNKDTTWIYNPPFSNADKGLLKVGDSSKFCYAKIFDALDNGLTSNKIYKVEKINAKEFLLLFTKQAVKEIHFEKLRLSFDELPLSFKNLESIAMFKEEKSDPVTFKRKSVTIMKQLDQSQFNFTAPANTEIEKMQ